MAKLVEIIGVTHNPNYPRRFANPGEEDPAIATIREGFEQMRQKMTASPPRRPPLRGQRPPEPALHAQHARLHDRKGASHPGAS